MEYNIKYVTFDIYRCILGRYMPNIFDCQQTNFGSYLQVLVLDIIPSILSMYMYINTYFILFFVNYF